MSYTITYPRRVCQMSGLHVRTKVHGAAALVTVISLLISIVLEISGFYATHDESRTLVNTAPTSSPLATAEEAIAQIVCGRAIDPAGSRSTATIIVRDTVVFSGTFAEFDHHVAIVHCSANIQ
jgi:hypothetical protein